MQGHGFPNSLALTTYIMNTLTFGWSGPASLTREGGKAMGQVHLEVPGVLGGIYINCASLSWRT